MDLLTFLVGVILDSEVRGESKKTKVDNRGRQGGIVCNSSSQKGFAT